MNRYEVAFLSRSKAAILVNWTTPSGLMKSKSLGHAALNLIECSSGPGGFGNETLASKLRISVPMLVSIKEAMGIARMKDKADQSQCGIRVDNLSPAEFFRQRVDAAARAALSRCLKATWPGLRGLKPQNPTGRASRTPTTTGE